MDIDSEIQRQLSLLSQQNFVKQIQSQLDPWLLEYKQRLADLLASYLSKLQTKRKYRIQTSFKQADQEIQQNGEQTFIIPFINSTITIFEYFQNYKTQIINQILVDLQNPQNSKQSGILIIEQQNNYYYNISIASIWGNKSKTIDQRLKDIAFDIAKRHLQEKGAQFKCRICKQYSNVPIISHQNICKQCLPNIVQQLQQMPKQLTHAKNNITTNDNNNKNDQKKEEENILLSIFSQFKNQRFVEIIQ